MQNKYTQNKQNIRADSAEVNAGLSTKWLQVRVTIFAIFCIKQNVSTGGQYVATANAADATSVVHRCDFGGSSVTTGGLRLVAPTRVSKQDSNSGNEYQNFFKNSREKSIIGWIMLERFSSFWNWAWRLWYSRAGCDIVGLWAWKLFADVLVISLLQDIQFQTATL